MIAVYVTLEQPTSKMRQEAAKAGLYHSKLYDRRYPSVQILTFKELVEDGKRPELPPSVSPVYRRAKRIDVVAAQTEQVGLTWGEPEAQAAESPEPYDSN